MKKNFLVLASIALNVLLVFFLTSCGGDDDNNKPADKAQISFSESSQTVNEADGTIEIEVTLDKPATERIIIDYELSGTAFEKTNPDPKDDTYDYEITSTLGEIKIDKGATSGTIQVKLYSDGHIEDDETITITLKSSDSETAEISADDAYEITVTQEDGILIWLDWGVGENENYTDVDMDLFLWIEDENEELVLSNIYSATESTETGEGFFLPNAILYDGHYGLSCNYYAGTADPMNFVVTYAEIFNGEEGTITTRNGTYTAANVNPWYTSEVDPILVMTFTKNGSTYSDFSQIEIPESGSRISTSALPTDVKRGTNAKVFMHTLR